MAAGRARRGDPGAPRALRGGPGLVLNLRFGCAALARLSSPGSAARPAGSGHGPA